MPTKSTESGRPKSEGYWSSPVFGLLIVVALLAGTAAILAFKDYQKFDMRRTAYEQIDDDIKSYGSRRFPWYNRWMYKLLGHEDSYQLSFLILHNEALVNDDKMIAISSFEGLTQVGLGGELVITDSGLRHLGRLKRLRALGLGDAPVTAQAVAKLRQSLPGCDITWEPPEVPIPGTRLAD